mmetsp:Transcript_23812/g.55534  ORF Transcript_23812/g.55534 Transcript_23812/m.55534 type:complete len:86 (+) Transcript_23812:238-495(+)
MTAQQNVHLCVRVRSNEYPRRQETSKIEVQLKALARMINNASPNQPSRVGVLVAGLLSALQILQYMDALPGSERGKKHSMHFAPV